MQFRVPQFLDVEDKIFGPFTFKQFGYLLGAIAFAYIFWKLLPVYVSMPLIILVSGTFLALAFVKINERPFGDILQAGFKYFLSSKIYVWQKRKIPTQTPQSNQNKLPTDSNGDERLRQNEMEIKKFGNTFSGLKSGGEKGEIRHFTFEQIKNLSNKLDVLNQPKQPKGVDRDLREEILKERNRFRI